MNTPAVLALDGTAPADRELLGGKAYSVNRMRSLGLPVPPAFAITTPVCARFHDNGGQLPDEVWDEVVNQLHVLEQQTGKTFGAGPFPLLVSVRSGAAQSMPGMMDTVLNLGLTEQLTAELAEATGDHDWARDTWARFCAGYGEIVLGDATSAPPPIRTTSCARPSARCSARGPMSGSLRIAATTDSARAVAPR